MNDNFDLKGYLGSKRLLKEADEDTQVRISTKDSTKVTGAAPDDKKGKWFPSKKSFYFLGSKQLEILKKWTPSVKNTSGRAESPGAKIVNGSLYVLVSMIPELEGKRGRGGKYGVRDDIKASFGDKGQSDAMNVLKAMEYAIKNSSENSVKLPGNVKDDETGDILKFEYKRIEGKGSDAGYAIPAAPGKETNEINNMNENKMNDNFDLKGYLGSKRLLKENFEMQEDEINEIDPGIAAALAPAAGFAATIATLAASGVMAALENGSMGEKGKAFAAKLKSLNKTSVKESNEDDDEEMDDSKYYHDEDENELSDDANLDDYEMPEKFAWEDDLNEVEDDEELPDDKKWYGSEEEDDEDIDLGDLESPEKYEWEDDF